MTNNNYRRDSSEEEALFRGYPYAVYFVQSPSTVSHANSADLRNNINESSTFQSPNRSGPIHNDVVRGGAGQEEALTLHRQFALSRYSSSRGSNHSSAVWHEKKISYDDLQSHEAAVLIGNGERCNSKGVKLDQHGGNSDDDDDDGEDEDEEDYFGRRRGWQQYFSFGYSTSFAWICLQLTWRVMISLVAALVVFYIATKPPPPRVSIKIARISEFALAEGVDATGVATKFLTCNCSMDLVIDNQSKLFGLRVHPPLMAMSFGKLPFKVSQGSELYAGPHGSTLFKLYTGTRNKPMYGAGRSMQDLLESGKGLPLMIRVDLRSKFHVVRGLINPNYHHRADCLLFLRRTYNKKHRTQEYNSTCTVIAS